MTLRAARSMSHPVAFTHYMNFIWPYCLEWKVIYRIYLYSDTKICTITISNLYSLLFVAYSTVSAYICQAQLGEKLVDESKIT